MTRESLTSKTSTRESNAVTRCAIYTRKSSEEGLEHESSEALRNQLSLPFPILCDTERRVVKDWDIYNSRERGGIAKPAVFVIDPNQVVRYASVDSVATRVPAAEIVHLLQSAANAQPIRRRVHIPMLSEWIRAIRNHFQS
jgi:alkyl hydroperoxide reductase subunit AhpC